MKREEMAGRLGARAAAVEVQRASATRAVRRGGLHRDTQTASGGTGERGTQGEGVRDVRTAAGGRSPPACCLSARQTWLYTGAGCGFTYALNRGGGGLLPAARIAQRVAKVVGVRLKPHAGQGGEGSYGGGGGALGGGHAKEGGVCLQQGDVMCGMSEERSVPDAARRRRRSTASCSFWAASLPEPAIARRSTSARCMPTEHSACCSAVTQLKSATACAIERTRWMRSQLGCG